MSGAIQMKEPWFRWGLRIFVIASQGELGAYYKHVRIITGIP